MSVNFKCIETVLLLIVASRIDAQTSSVVKKDDMTVWYPNQAMDVWSGKKSLINVITNDFFGVLNGVALNPQTEWRPQTKFDPEHIPASVRDRDSVKVVELDDEEDDYDEDYEDDVDTFDYYEDEESKRKNNTKYGQY